MDHSDQDPQEPEVEPQAAEASGPEEPPGAEDELEDDDDEPVPDGPIEGLFRAVRIFMVPFLLSWAVAYIASQLSMDWLVYVGMAGVGASVIGLWVWLLNQ